jgi:hypothetical protein
VLPELMQTGPKKKKKNYLYNTLEILMMGIKVPETC